MPAQPHLDWLVYLVNTAISTVPAVFIRPLFGWKSVEMFSATDEERDRPEATVYAS